MAFNALRRRELWLTMAGAMCIVIFAWSFALISNWTKSAEQPGIEAIPPQLDYHRDERHAKGIVEVALYNRDSRTVKLLEIKASCGCTLPKEIPSMEVQAGKHVSLKLEVDPPGFGLRNSIVTIRTDSPATPIVQIPIQLYGQKLSPPFIHLAPDNIRVDSILGAAPPISKFQVICVEAPGAAWLQEFNSDFKAAVLKPLRIVKEERVDASTLMRHYETELEITPSFSSDTQMSFWLTPVARSKPTSPFPQIRVAFSQVKAIRAAPSSVLMTFSNKKKITRQIVLIAADLKEWEITSVEADVPWLTIQAEVKDPAVRNGRITISATNPGNHKAKIQHCDVRIHTSHPQCREVVVRVTVVQG